MAKNPIRVLSWGVAMARRMCTATAAAAAAAEAAAQHRPLYRRLSALGGVSGGSVAATMEGWLKEGRVVRDVEIMSFVREFRKYKSYKLALELMDWMETRGMNMSFRNHAVRIDLISKVKSVDLAESYFSTLPDLAKNQFTYGALLSSYCHDKMADKAIALYKKMTELNLASSTLVHNNLMTLYMKLGQPEKVQTLFQEMKANSIPPDDFTYCMVMNSYASLNDIDSIEKVVEEIKEEGFTLDWSIYANLASHYNAAGLFEKAEAALKKLEEVMDKRDRKAFHFLISLYAGAGNLAEVIRLWKSLKATFPKTTNMSYYLMLQALSKLDDMDGLKQCFKEWESVYVTYDIRLVNVMIGAYLRKGMIKEVEPLWEKATEKGFGSDLRTLELFMDYYLKSREMDLALTCFETIASQVKQSQWKPDKEKLTTFLKYFEEAKDVNGAEAFYRSLKKLDCLNVEAYESLLRTYLVAGRKEPLLHQRIKEDGIKLSYESEKLIESICY